MLLCSVKLILPLFNGILISLGTKLNSNNPLTTVAFPLKIVSPCSEVYRRAIVVVIESCSCYVFINIAVKVGARKTQ
jgi:hypothetical protein